MSSKMSAARARWTLLASVAALWFGYRYFGASQSEPELIDASFLFPALHSHELPDQLRIDGKVPAKHISAVDLSRIVNPTLDRAVAAVSSLSARDAEIYQALKRMAPRFPASVEDRCGDLIERQAANQKREGVPRIIFFDYNAMDPLPGLADRLKGVVSAFALAYALDLPFHMHWDATEMLAAEKVVESPYLNWAWPDYPYYSQTNDPEASFFLSLSRIMDTPQEDIYWNKTTKQQLLDFVAPKKLNFWSGNLGHASGGFLHPESYLGQALKERGLTNTSVYRCFLDYLIQPIKSTRDALAPYQALLLHPSVFSVMIHARTGDENMIEGYGALLTGEVSPEYALHYFQCAKIAVEEGLEDRHKLVVVYVATDNIRLRNLVRRSPDKVKAAMKWDLPVPIHFVVGPSVPAHVSLDSQLSAENPKDHPAMQAQMQAAIMEMWLQDSADVRLITMYSGFGAWSALRTWDFRGSNTTYVLNRPTGEGRDLPVVADGWYCEEGPSKLSIILGNWGFY